jgi:hypothetical protein
VTASSKTIAANLAVLAGKSDIDVLAKAKAKTKSSKLENSKVLEGRKKTTPSIPTRVVKPLPIMHRRIADDTTVVPLLTAETVAKETCRFVHSNVPMQYIKDLADKAHKTFNNKDGKFAEGIRSRGEKGRDHLYAFMQAWISEMLKKDHPDLFKKLPVSFSRNEPGEDDNKPPDSDD